MASAPEEAFCAARSSAPVKAIKHLISISALPSTNLSMTSGAMQRLHIVSRPALCTISFSEKRRSRALRHASAWTARDRSSSLTMRRLVRPMAASNCISSCLCSSISARGRTASSCSLYCSSAGLVTMQICASDCRAASRAFSSSKSTSFSSALTAPLLTRYERCSCVLQMNLKMWAMRLRKPGVPFWMHLHKFTMTGDAWLDLSPARLLASSERSTHQVRSCRASSGEPASTSPFFAFRISGGSFSMASSNAVRSSSASSLIGYWVLFGRILSSRDKQKL
mmetsp:Transcript_27350/g.63784  ORF Transcript_27350/g.63784 Transcript_27350/m.63784 type:complete len:281 (+) Transcript_27350:329-1171(+)